MSARRSPRTLRDVSHLFLSSGASLARGESESAAVSMWVAALGPSVNRAFLAAGTAAACANHGMRVTLVEACRDLPNVGYYFGMDPAGYLAPALDRSTLVCGAWGDCVRYRFSANPRSCVRERGEFPPSGAPRAAVCAFDLPPDVRVESASAELGPLTARLSCSGGERGGVPDCIIVAADERGAARGRFILSEFRKTRPQSVLFFVVGRPDRGSASGADETFTLPSGIRASWHLRVPPRDPFFGELVASALQMVSARRRKAVGRAANA